MSKNITTKSVTKKNVMLPKWKTSGTAVKKNRGTKLTKDKHNYGGSVL